MHPQTYGRVNARVDEKVLALFQESFNATTIFLQLRHFQLDVFQEVRVGPIKSKQLQFSFEVNNWWIFR